MPDATLARLIMPTNHIAHFNKLSFIPYSSTSAIIDFQLNHHLMNKIMTKPNHELSPALIVLMSIATGLAVASNYYAQPLLDTIARNFSLSASSAGFIVTAAQLGYAAGLLFLVPLGDMFERRRLIVSMTLLAAGGMLITASSQSLAMMILGTALTGLFSVVAQILVPLAATLASPDKRGKVVGTIMSGLLLGILLARTVAGLLANLGGWRTVFGLPRC